MSGLRPPPFKRVVMLTPALGRFRKIIKMKIIFILKCTPIIVFLIIIICTALVIYKLISRELKKNSEIQKKIINECKSEEERNIALNNLKKNNKKKVIISSLVFYIGLPIICFPCLLLIRKSSISNIKPIGSYVLFEQNGITYYGKHEYSIFCENNGFLIFSTYKIFDKKNKSVFETKSYEEFLNKLEEMFSNHEIKKINFYGTCLSDPGYKSLGYAINNSNLIESHEIEELPNGQLIHIKTVNGILINIEYLWEDMICTCKGA